MGYRKKTLKRINKKNVLLRKINLKENNQDIIIKKRENLDPIYNMEDEAKKKKLHLESSLIKWEDEVLDEVIFSKNNFKS